MNDGPKTLIRLAVVVTAGKERSIIVVSPSFQNASPLSDLWVLL